MPRNLHRRAFALIERAYACAEAPARWQEFANELSRELGGAGLAVVLDWEWQANPLRLFLAGLEPDVMSSYVEHFHPLSPWQGSSGPGTCGEVVVHSEPGPEIVVGTEYYKRFLEPQGLAPGPRVSIVLSEKEGRAQGILSLMPHATAPLGQEELELLRLLGPHVARACQLCLRLDEGRVARGGLTEALDRLHIGVLLTDERGVPVYANRSAAEVLGVEPAGGPSGQLERIRDAFQGLSGKFRVGTAAEGVDSLLMPHPVDGRPLPVIASQLAGGTSAFGHDVRHAIFIGDPRCQSGSPLEMLKSLYGLTRAEAKLTALLVTGLSLAEAARELGIALGTARTRLKRVFAKTQVDSQRNLIRLVLSGPGMLRVASSSSRP